MALDDVWSRLHLASVTLSVHTEEKKNRALSAVADAIESERATILGANARDVARARAGGMSEALVERLALDGKKFGAMIDGIQTVIRQKDPVGEVVRGWKIPSGVEINEERVPLGIVAIIYEGRPNVTADAFALAYKSGNALLLRGSSSALESNKAIVHAIRAGLEKAGDAGVPDSVYLCESGERGEVGEILGAKGKVDVVLPRGSASLINFVVENAKVPVIQTGAGVCHLYVDESADLAKAARIAQNAKMQRPGACNAIETILVHRAIVRPFLERVAPLFGERVEVRADEACYEALSTVGYKNLKHATEHDFGYEFLDFIVAVRTVENCDEAIAFINSHNTKHSDCIVTENLSNAHAFQSRVDAACVYVNASTRFTDGGMFGFGAELGISTQKLHARGPMGASALTTTKFLITGEGQVRP